MSFRDYFSKPARIVRYFLFACLLTPAVFAELPQRLILQFDTVLNAEQKQTLTQQIQDIIKSGFSILPHSTEQKWIIVINPPIDITSLEKANSEIIRLKHVRYVETDQRMNTLPRNEYTGTTQGTSD